VLIDSCSGVDRNDAQVMVGKHMALAQPDIDTLRAYRRSNGALTPSTSHGFPWYALRNASGTLIGAVTLAPFENDPRGLSAEQMRALPRKEQCWIIGYKLDPAYQGNGLMTAALRVVLEEWVREWMGIGQVTAVCFAFHWCLALADRADCVFVGH
jgi:RimJ/RimL family protein N-acetyltransferase